MSIVRQAAVLVFACSLAFTSFAGELACDVAVVGGGSAGFAAALAAAEGGCETVLVEREAMLGGTSTIGGVNNWEPVCGATGVSRRVYERLAAIPGACGVWTQKLHCTYGDAFPGALLEIDPSLSYFDTLRRHGEGMSDREKWLARYHGIVFEPRQLDGVMRQMLKETGHCTVLTSTAYRACRVKNGVIRELTLADGRTLRPKVVIDTCGLVARDAGCKLETAENPNGATLIFRVTRDPSVRAADLPEDTPTACWWAKGFPVVFCCRYPNGDLNVNMLPTMSGREALELGEKAAYAECRRRVAAQWRWMQTNYPRHFAGYRIREVASRLACRETHRVVCEYMLTGEDVAAGRRFPDEIATADHAFDNHGGTRAFKGELKKPYGIPLRSLKPVGVRNLYVAGRIAGFDVDAATSCRLSRTMMELGAAAGQAAARNVLTQSRRDTEEGGRRQ